MTTIRGFLSCLYGSEPVLVSNSISSCFLSCLYGSEHLLHNYNAHIFFLSCLYGSEQNSFY
nr:Putative uncharacterized protein [Moritella viscosa]